MKVRIISFILALTFVSLITFEYISDTMIIENSSSKTIEYVLEKRVSDKFIDYTYLKSLNFFALHVEQKQLHTFKVIIYTYKSKSTLFRPPITL